MEDCRRGSNSSGCSMSVMERECLHEKRRNAKLLECSEMLRRDSTQRYNRDAFKDLFQNEVLLDKLFTLFDQDRDGLLKQEEWIEFLKGRLTKGKQQDFVDQIESVAYVLGGEEPINFIIFRQIFRAKGIVEKLLKLIDVDCVGSVTPEQIMEFIIAISNPRIRVGFDEQNLAWLEKIFKQTVGNEKEIRREEFKNICTSKNPFFTERVFQIFDKDGSGTISLQEFLDAMHQFAGKSPDDKIKFLFKVYDIDGDGLIQLRELEHVLRACMEENGMRFSDEQIEDLTGALFEDADKGRRGAITFEALKRQLQQHDGLLQNLTISIDRWLVPPQPIRVKKTGCKLVPRLRPYQLTKPYLKNNYVKLSFVSAFLLVNFALFATRAWQLYNRQNLYVVLARACGQCLNFDCTFVLVLMLRQCITFLRTRGLSSALPLDNHIYLHKMTGGFIVAFSFVHALMHLLNFCTVVIHDQSLNGEHYTMTEWLLTTKPKLFGLVAGGANPTGVALVVILTIMVVCSMPFVRRGGCFEIFYWTHLLYIPFWMLMVFHGPNFWKWFVGPGIVYGVERIRRLARFRAQRGKTYISSGLLLPSKVTHLVIKKPPNFHFRPGDYVFANVPAIAKYEWHPFTISSAPEQEEYMWLHVRAVGEWTNSLYSYFEKEQQKLHQGKVLPEHCVPRKTPCKILRKNSNVLLDDPRAASNLGYLSENDEETSSSTAVADFQTAAIENTSKIDGYSYSKLSRENKLQLLKSASRPPLEKSFSMPDMQVKKKRRQRIMVLRDFARSESEKSFDECSIRRARLKSLGLAYLSPQNKSLAQSFRYMRTKPTIIAFKTPSLENCEYDCSAPRAKLSLSDDAEESKVEALSSIIVEEGRVGESAESVLNYPVGKPLEILLDGPYGAPSSHIFQAQHAVLIATGIGVTPFASILQSIMHRYWKERHTCPKCCFAWASEIPATVMNLRKVDFFWINRDQRSFEWFVNLLSQLEIEQAELGGSMERFLEMHMYITSALQKSDMKAVGLQLALDLLHEKEKRDLITGLKTRTNAGRPNWDKVFKQLQDRKKGKITVFYCGPPQLARSLRYKCDRFGFSFRKESF